MSKTSRRERKIYKEGHAAGYIKGYKDGLHDGNVFARVAEAIVRFADDLVALEKNEEADE